MPSTGGDGNDLGLPAQLSHQLPSCSCDNTVLQENTHTLHCAELRKVGETAVGGKPQEQPFCVCPLHG